MVTGPACGERLVAAAAASEGANLTISGKEFVENQSLAESQPCLPPHQSLMNFRDTAKHPHFHPRGCG